VTNRPADSSSKEKAAPPQRSAAFLESKQNRADTEADGVSAFSVPSFSLSAQGRFYNFISPEVVDEIRIAPGDVYGLGSPSLPRINQDKIEPAQTEPGPAEAPLLDTLGINVELEHNHSNRADRRKRVKFVKKRWLKNPEIGRTKRESAKLLRAAGYEDLAADVERCGQEHLVRICKRCRGQGKPCFHGISHTIDPCDLIYFCPDCARHRSGRAKKRYTPIVQKFAHLNRLLYTPIFITLTIRSGFDLEALLDLLFESFRRFRSRSAWKDHIVGAIASCELTFNPQYGWHPHIHIVAFRRAFWDSDELKESWSASTRAEGLITDIRRVNGDLKGALSELLKYLCKPCDIKKLGVEQVHELVALKRRMVMTLGKLRKFEVTKADREKYGDGADYDPLNCLVCDAPLSSVLFSAQELERMSCVVVLRGP